MTGWRNRWYVECSWQSVFLKSWRLQTWLPEVAQVLRCMTQLLCMCGSTPDLLLTCRKYTVWYFIMKDRLSREVFVSEITSSSLSFTVCKRAGSLFSFRLLNHPVLSWQLWSPYANRKNICFTDNIFLKLELGLSMIYKWHATQCHTGMCIWSSNTSSRETTTSGCVLTNITILVKFENDPMWFLKSTEKNQLENSKENDLLLWKAHVCFQYHVLKSTGNVKCRSCYKFC